MTTKTESFDVLASLDRAIERNIERGAAIGSPSDRDLRKARVVVSELIAKSERFGLLFEAWSRDGDDSVPLKLQGTTENEVINAMYEMRATIARIGGDK